MPTTSFSHPWAAGRPAILTALSGEADVDSLPDSAVHDETRTQPLAALAVRLDLFSTVVDPLIEAIDKDTDVATLIGDALSAFSDAPSLAPATRLYQLLLNDKHYPDNTWRRLAAILRDGPLGEDRAVRDLLVGWLAEAPDRTPIDTSLFLLTYLRSEPPQIELLQGLARHHGFVSGVAAVITRRFDLPVVETALLTLAKLYSGTLRTMILQRLTTVESTAGRDWLLTEGYDNGLDYETSAWSAAVLGRMIEGLREPELPLDDLVHRARTLERMAEVAGMQPFFGHWFSINDYSDGPEALGHVIDHAGRLAELPAVLWRPLVDLLYFLEEDGAGESVDGEQFWPEAVVGELAARLAALLDRPEVDVNAYWWRRPDPTLADLQAGAIDKLNPVVSRADGQALLAVVDWVIGYLALDAPAEAARLRREELLATPLAGTRQGGLAGMTDEALGSVYGQVLLQLLLRLKETGTVAGWPLLRAALAAEVPMLREVAAGTLEAWSPAGLPAELPRQDVLAALQAALLVDPNDARLLALWHRFEPAPPWAAATPTVQ